MDFFNDIKNKITGNHGESMASKPQQFRIRGRVIQEEKLLTEGGFGYIWKARDVNTQEVFALKRIMCQTKETLDGAKQEMKILEKLPRHPNIVQYFGGEIYPYDNGKMIVYLMELCEDGTLFELMEKKQHSKFSENELLNIMKQVAQGISAMHQMHPAMAHRDIKIENVLISQGRYKLCDFGSSSSQTVNFSKVHKSEYVDYEEVFEKTTTPMYRPPEMCDPYLGYFVNEKVDVWMLGCVLYTLCYFIHPFVEGQKTGICNAIYDIPQSSKYSEKLHDFIRHMLTPNPQYRPEISEILMILQNWNQQSYININSQAQQLKQRKVQELKEEQAFKKNVKQISYGDGDIPIEQLMNLQNKIRKEEVDTASFAAQNRKKKQEEWNKVQQQKQRTQQQKQNQQQNFTSGQKNNSNTSDFGFGSTSKQFSSTTNSHTNDIWDSTSAQKNQNQKTTTTGGWDSQWDTPQQNNKQQQQQEIKSSQGGSIWDLNITGSSNQKQSQNQQAGGWEQSWDQPATKQIQQQQPSGWDNSWNHISNEKEHQFSSNPNPQFGNNQQGKVSSWDQEWGSGQNNRQQQQQQSQKHSQFQQTSTHSQQQQQQQQQGVDDLLDIGAMSLNQNQQKQKDIDITDILF